MLNFACSFYPRMEKKHRFWNSQPVDVSDGNEIICKPAVVPTEPSNLPDGFSFEGLSSIDELSMFLGGNYVEDFHQGHILIYSPRFLQWMLKSNGNMKSYSLVLRWKGEMVGFAFAKEHKLSIRGVEQKVVSVNLLCVARCLRGRRISPVIIREITRRVNLDGIYQAIFTSGTKFFFNVSDAYYYHRALDPIRLFRTGFSDRVIELGIPKPRSGTRLVTELDLPSLLRLFSEEAKKYVFCEKMGIEEVYANLMPVKDIIYTYVHEVGDEITEFGSFFILETLEKKTGELIKGAYLYYRTDRNLIEMISDLMCFAKSEGCDVFNCLNIMGNSEFLDKLGFERGTGHLRYYLYNWRTQWIEPNEVFFVLH